MRRQWNPGLWVCMTALVLASRLAAGEPAGPGRDLAAYLADKEVHTADRAFSEMLNAFRQMGVEMQSASDPKPFRQRVLTKFLPKVEAAVERGRRVKPATPLAWKIHTPLLESLELLDASLWQWAQGLRDLRGAAGKAAVQRGTALMQRAVERYKHAQTMVAPARQAAQAEAPPLPLPTRKTVATFLQGPEMKSLEALRLKLLKAAATLEKGNAAASRADVATVLPDAQEAVSLLRQVQTNAATPLPYRQHLLAGFEAFEAAFRYCQRGLALNDQAYIERGTKAFRTGAAERGLAEKALLAVLKRSNPAAPEAVEIPADPMHPVALMHSASDLLALLRADPALAGSLFMTVEAELAFADVRELCGPLLKYFAYGALPLIQHQDADHALVALYQPWVDVLLLTEWRREEAGARIHDVELLTGDMLRQAGEPPYEVEPLWVRDGEVLPPVALRQATAETSKAFHTVFAKALPAGRWRLQLEPLHMPELLVPNSALAALRMAAMARSFRELAEAPEHAALAAALNGTLDRLHAGETDAVIKTATDTHGPSAQLLRTFPPRFWQQAQLMAARQGPDSAFVFLNAPGMPKLFVSLFYRKSETGTHLGRLDLFDLPIAGPAASAKEKP